MNLSLKFFGLVCILLIGVFIGVKTAESGIEKIQHQPDDKIQAYYITKIDKGKTEVAHVQTEKKSLSAKDDNFVSKTGVTIGGWVKHTTHTTVGWLTGFFQP